MARHSGCAVSWPLEVRPRVWGYWVGGQSWCRRGEGGGPVGGSTLCAAYGRSGRRRGCAGGVGGTRGPPRDGAAVSRQAAVRVLRAGLHRRSPGPRDLTSPAAAPGPDAGSRAGTHRGGVLRYRAEPDAGVGAPPAGRRPGGGAGGSGPGLGRDRDRRIRAGLLREPVRFWSRPGPMASPPTGAATATPAPPVQSRDGGRTSTSAKTRSCPASRRWESCSASLAVVAGTGAQHTCRSLPGRQR